LTLIIGLQKTLVFFSRPQKLKGTAAFCAGILLILLRWPLTGFLIELYGLFILFGDFLVTIGQFAGNIPVVGPYIKRGMEVLAGGRSNAELPVWVLLLGEHGLRYGHWHCAWLGTFCALAFCFNWYMDEHGVTDDTILYGLPGWTSTDVITNDLFIRAAMSTVLAGCQYLTYIIEHRADSYARLSQMFVSIQ
jgi:Got1/Sft2-like family